MKRIKLSLFFVLLAVCTVFGQQAKYVFYFIGDGMGVNQVQGTELYLGELEGKIGITPLQFTQFPYSTVATTFSATNGVTDSAAAGNMPNPSDENDAAALRTSARSLHRPGCSAPAFHARTTSARYRCG